MTGGTFDVEKSLNTGNHDDDDDESQEGDNLLTTINILRNKNQKVKELPKGKIWWEQEIEVKKLGPIIILKEG